MQRKNNVQHCSDSIGHALHEVKTGLLKYFPQSFFFFETLTVAVPQSSILNSKELFTNKNIALTSKLLQIISNKQQHKIVALLPHTTKVLLTTVKISVIQNPALLLIPAIQESNLEYLYYLHYFAIMLNIPVSFEMHCHVFFIVSDGK